MKWQRWMAILIFSMLMLIDKRRELAACGQLQQQLTIQHTVDTRITHGNDTQIWPWHAAIYHRRIGNDSSYHCGGTLVSSKFILTAAHCVSVGVEEILVSLGRLNLNDSQNSAPFIKVAQKFVHPDYNETNFENDIAILTLATDAIINSNVQPICMWKSDKIDLSEVIGRNGTVVGWGLRENGELSDVLQEASLPVVPYFTCLRSNSDVFGHLLTGSNFCAGARNGISVCSGDSGGSMTFPENGRFYIRGIVSVSAAKLVDVNSQKFMCDSEQYALFTDVAQYLPWIAQITKITGDTQITGDTLITKTTEITEATECVTIVRCVLSQRGDGSDICAVTLNESAQKCKVTFETSSVNVRTLDVYQNGTSDIPDLSSAVDRFVKLDSLYLNSFNRIDRSRLSPFRNVGALAFDAFSSAHFNTDTLVDFVNLEFFSIWNSRDTILPAGSIRNNNIIQIFLFNFNRFYDFDFDVFKKLRNVRRIELVSNEIASLPADIFSVNENLSQLNLSSNILKEVHADLFNGLTNLEVLNLSSNRIEFVPPGLFRSNSKLTSVDLSDNKIKEIEVDLSTMPQLGFLALLGNGCIDENFHIQTESLSAANEIIRITCDLHGPLVSRNALDLSSPRYSRDFSNSPETKKSLFPSNSPFPSFSPVPIDLPFPSSLLFSSRSTITSNSLFPSQSTFTSYTSDPSSPLFSSQSTFTSYSSFPSLLPLPSLR